MWGDSCNDAEAIKRECFTCQRCGQNGQSGLSTVDFNMNIISVVLMDGDTFAGLLMGMHQNGTLFVHNVCVEHSHRGRGFAAQLFAWLGVVYKGPLSLTVYGPTAALFKSNRMVLNEVSKRFKKLLTMYGRYGFTIVGIQNDMVQMQAGALRSVPPAKGTRLTL
jgi:hypothetical protein